MTTEERFTLQAARALLPAVRERAEDLIVLRADLADLALALQQGVPSALGGVAEAKAAEARISELLGWFNAQGLHVKGIAPLLLDFPAEPADVGAPPGEPVLLCWLEGEPDLAWWHPASVGFAARRRIGS